MKIIKFSLEGGGVKKISDNGVKALYFVDWCQVAEMMKDKKHLTKEGISGLGDMEKIKK